MKAKTSISSRFLSLLLVLLLALTTLPTAALAADVSSDEHVHIDACDHAEITISIEAVSPDISSEETSPTEEATDPNSGVIAGSSVAWTFDPSTGRLIITGSGDCPTFQSADDQPWAAVCTQITEVWFYDMDTLSISNLAYWFDGCTSLVMAELPYTTPVIGTRAFANCPSLQTILVYHDGDLSIASDAFAAGSLSALEIRYMPASEATLSILSSYNWAADNRVVFYEDVYGISMLATGTCATCGKTCSYTLAYEQWTSSVHCVRHWCSNCGDDQCGGVLGESHTFSNGTCTKCGYSNGSGGGSGGSTCYHTSTYTTWSGCNWYEYCYSCGALVDYGTSHGTYVYGNWEYYSSTQHRRTKTCSNCGESSYSYGSHSTSTKYTQYSSTQHTVGSYCATCGSYVGSTSYESHNFTYGAWSNYSSTQHRRTKTCSDCGYSTYEYASHTLSYSSWSSISDTQHHRTVSCSCGYSTTETANHAFIYGAWTAASDTEHSRSKTCSCGYSSTETGSHADTDGDGYCDGCGYLMSRFSVTLPASMAMTVSEDGEIHTAQDVVIINHSTAAVQVTGVSVTAAGSWTLVPYAYNMAAAKVDSKLIGFSLNGAVTKQTGSSENLTLSGDWTIAKGASLPLMYDAVVSATSTTMQDEQVLTLVFVLDWASL